MISKNVKYGISENVTIAKFGSGDIIVADGYMMDDNNINVGYLTLTNDMVVNHRFN